MARYKKNFIEICQQAANAGIISSSLASRYIAQAREYPKPTATAEPEAATADGEG